MKNIFKISRVILISLFIIGLSSCEKDKMVLLTDGIWTFSNMTTDSDNTDIQTWVAFGKALLVDSTLEFFDDGSYELDSPLADNPETGSWTLVGDVQLIMTPSGELAGTSSIKKLTRSELIFVETFDDEGTAFSTTTKYTR